MEQSENKQEESAKAVEQESSELTPRVEEKSRHKKGSISDGETSVMESDASAHKKHRKHKKKHKKKGKDGSESETEKRKKKKHKKKGADKGDSESETEGKHRKRHHHKRRHKGKDNEHVEPTPSESKSAPLKLPSGPVIEKRAARKPGQGMDPMEWSREDLMDKVARFATYETDRGSGCGSFTVEGRRMLGEEIKVTLELFRRNTETQFVTFKKCFMTDENLAQLAEGLKGLRHVKKLNLSQNALTRESTLLLIEMFANAGRKLQSLDLRDNLLNEEDSRMLYYAFQTIHFLNGVNLVTLKNDSEDKSYNLSDKGMTITEIAVVCCVLKRYTYLDCLDISKNAVTSECLELLAEVLLDLRNIKRIVMSHNPLTNGGQVMTGIKAMMNMLRVNKSILYVSLDGGMVPQVMAENIERSLMVNRCIANSIQGNQL